MFDKCLMDMDNAQEQNANALLSFTYFIWV